MRTLLPLLVGITATVPFAGAQNWNSWRTDNTFHGIEVRTRCVGFNDFAGRYLWDVQLRNRYPGSVDVTWIADPQRLRGAEAQTDRAVGVRPGETVDAHHTAPVDCSTGLMVRVNAVRSAGGALDTTAQEGPQQKPQFQGHWASRDPEELRKSLTVQVFDDAVTSEWSSPGFSFQITTPRPKNLHGSVSVDSPAQTR